jgi:cysteine desulfurase
MKQVYLDYNATTPVHPEVVAVMLPFFSESFANAASPHKPGRTAEIARMRGTKQLANLINATPDEIVFTGGGTEANNIALLGVAKQAAAKGKKQLITSPVEHSASYETCQHLAETGFDVVFLKVDSRGMIDLDELASAITDETALVSLILANNETGTIQDYAAIKKIVTKKNIPLHYDAVQALGKMPLDMDKMGVDLLSVSAHKIYGPKGIGALFVRRGTGIDPILYGGGPKLRPGTHNIPAIAGFGQACQLASKNLNTYTGHCRGMRDYLEQKILALPTETKVNGNLENRITNTTNISFIGHYAATLSDMLDTRGIAVSTGAACSTKDSVSRVLNAMGLPALELFGALRFSVGNATTIEDIDYTIEQLAEVLKAAEKTDGGSEIVSLG